MVSTPVDNAPAFLQLRDKYKQELVEDTRLTKAADLAAKEHVLLASDAPDAWKRPELKAVGRQLRMRATGATTPGEDDFEAGPVHAWFTQLVKATQGIKQGTTPGGPRKPPVLPKPNIIPSAKKKLKFTPQVSTQELAQELPFSEDIAPKPWETPTLAVKRKIRKKAAAVAKKKAESLAKKALDWKTWKTP